jgi:hypothetical protein
MYLSEPDFESHSWESLPGEIRSEVRLWISAFKGKPEKNITAWLKGIAKEMGVSIQTATRKYYELRNNGGDWTALIDQRKATTARAATAKARQPRFAAHLCKLVEENGRKSAPAFKVLKRQWKARITAIPGYEDWQGWPQIPAGWTDRNLARIVEDATNIARIQSIRVGTSSKTNPFLPTVLTTRVGLHPGAIIQLDDQWHDNLVTVGKKRELVRVLELGALDVFSSDRFHWGARPRRRRENDTFETLGGKDMRLFLAGMFHQYGYSPHGTMLMSEHQTAKVSEDIARILYDSTRGLVRVDYQPIEGKQAALCGFWNGTEGGNFRAKAALESTHNLIRNDMGNTPMQLGSFSSGIQGSVNTSRQVAYIAKIIRDVLAKVPHRLDLLKLPTLDFHTQFLPLLQDYYELGLAARTDHDLEGWERLGHVVTEYCAIPNGSDFFSEQDFLNLPGPSQQIIRHAANQAPAQWSRRRNLSPREVWLRRPRFNPIPPAVIIEMLTGDLAREVKSDRGFLTFSDQEIAPDPLVYFSRYCSGPNQGCEIPHGQKVLMFVLPWDDDTAIVVDAKERFLGEVALYNKPCPVDPSAFGSDAPFEMRPEIRSAELIRAAGEKHERIANIMEPSRIIHAPRVQEARDLREHNRKVISGEPVTAEEIHEARVAAGQQAHRTAAANRLNEHGTARTWEDPGEDNPYLADTYEDPFAQLPDSTNFPDSI